MNFQQHHLDDYDFALLARHSRCVKEKQRLLILANLKDGKRQSDIAETLKISLSSVGRTIGRFRESGLSDLKDRPRSGAPLKLSPEQRLAVKDRLLALQQARSGGRLTGEDIQVLLKKEWQVSYCLSAVYNLLHALNLSWISCRSRHPKQDPQRQEDFKKLQ